MNTRSHTALFSHRSHFYLFIFRSTPPLQSLLKVLFISLSQKKISFIIHLKWDRDNESRICQLSDVEILVRIKGRAEELKKGEKLSSYYEPTIVRLFPQNRSVGLRIEECSCFSGKATSRGSYGDKPDFANIYLHIEIWERQKLSERGDLSPVLMVLLYFL